MSKALLPGSSAPTNVPPLPGALAATLETRFFPPVHSDQRVLVGLDGAGRPISIDVVHRLRLVRVGDYTFAVPGPIRDVAPVAGSRSEPGLRRDAIVWAGFSPGNRLLAARIALRPGAAAGALPMRIAVTAGPDRVSVTFRNTTAARVQAFAGDAVRASVAEQLDATREVLRRGLALGEAYVDVRGTPRAAEVAAIAPLDVAGRLTFPPGALEGAEIEGGRRRGRAVEFRGRIGDGGPLELRVTVRGVRARPALSVRATPVWPANTLRPRGARTWAAAARRGADARSLLATLMRARLAAARAEQYERYLAPPDPRGRTEATYVYETARPSAGPAPAPASGGDTDGWVVWLAAALGLVALGGGVVWWAHS